MNMTPICSRKYTTRAKETVTYALAYDMVPFDIVDKTYKFWPLY